MVTEDKATYKVRFGAVLTEVRLARGYARQLDLAEALGIHESTVQAWEAGHSLPDAWNIRNLAAKAVLNVDPGILIDPPDHVDLDALDVGAAAAATIRRKLAMKRRPPPR